MRSAKRTVVRLKIKMAEKIKIPSGNILSIDIGGTNIKACVLNQKGKMLTDFEKEPTPENATPEKVLATIENLTAGFTDFSKVSVGFPGYIKRGYVQTAPNLAPNQWANVNLAQLIANKFSKPVRLVNDADMQGIGLIKGDGLEVVFTLGTGFGTALFFDGEMLPHFELSHMPVTKKQDFDDFIGKKAYKEIGKKKWNKRVQYIIETYKTVFNYDKLYISGGNAAHLNFELDHNIKIAGNKDGIKGGAKLWKVKEKFLVHTNFPKNNN